MIPELICEIGSMYRAESAGKTAKKEISKFFKKMGKVDWDHEV